MKRFIIAAVVILCNITNTYSQNAEVKVNLAAGALTIFNPSIELQLKNHSSATFDYVGAFSRNDFLNTGSPLLFSMGLFGYRYYLRKDRFDGFFMGADFGLLFYRMDKNIIPLVPSDHGDGQYDVGYGYVMGGTVGYKYNFAKRWGVEASVSYGFQHSQHEGYTEDGVRMFDMNATAEWTPYKAGIYINYKLWK